MNQARLQDRQLRSFSAVSCCRARLRGLATDFMLPPLAQMIGLLLTIRCYLSSYLHGCTRLTSFHSWRSRLAGDGFLFHFEQPCLQGKPATTVDA